MLLYLVVSLGSLVTVTNCVTLEVQVCKTKADVILVFDASASIGEEHFDKQLVFAKKLTSNFKLGPNYVRFGGIEFSRFAKILFDLKDYNTHETLHKALSNVTYMDSSTHTNDAFQLIDQQQLFSTAKGGRGDAADIVVLFTDGNPSQEIEAKTLETAQILKDSGVLILVVAIGSDLDLSVLKTISSTPDDVLRASSYDTLEYIEKRLTQLLCQDVDECSDSPCEHTCTNTEGSFRCSCRDGFAVDPNNKNTCTEVEVCKTKADVILVFDASDSIGAEHFDKQFVFAKRLTSNFKLGPSDVRFGGIVFSKKSEKLFDLKDHSTLETLHKALSNVTYMASSTYTHGAFQLIDQQQLFSVDNGGRGDAPDIVVLFTDGNPTSVTKALKNAQKLKDSGILILGIAIGSELDLSVLKKITSTPEGTLEASSYDTLQNIEKRLTELLCQISKSSQRIE